MTLIPFASALAFLVQATTAPTPLVDPLATPDVASAPVTLTLPQQTSVRCSAAFAVVVRERNRDGASYPEYPELHERGQEFFIQALAQVMDETGMGREAVTSLVMAEVDTLSEPQALKDIMPGCLLLLDASGV